MKPVHIYARGKLLITGEYLVLHGAKAFALPLKFGQHTHFYTSESIEKSFEWISYEYNKIWFRARINNQNFELIDGEENDSSQFVMQLLKTIRRLKPDVQFKHLTRIEHSIDFNKEWGFGSSSTLIFNMAAWAGINPFELHFEVSKGSGYDIAAADAMKPYFYQIHTKKPNIEFVDWNIPFKNQLLFVYSGKKQSSDASIQKTMKNTIDIKLINKIGHISEQVHHANTINEFVMLINEHEKLIGQYLNRQPIKEEKFRDFNGTIKSLGAWGGDFLMAVGFDSIDNSIQYFTEKGLNTYFTFADLIYE